MKRLLISASGLIAALLIVVVGIRWVEWQHRYTSPVPKNIVQGVSFPIYYPVQKILPVGYTLDLNSFEQPRQNGISYMVSNNKGQKLVFSLQPKPSSSALQNFEANYIPLNNSYQTANGQALIGAYNTKTGIETLVSLPTDSSTWVIITGPSNINQTQLKQVLSSLKN
jgi:hypothetical protein